MSQIKISLVEQSRVATPPGGELRIFADADNLGHLSTKDSQGHIEDLTDKGGNGFSDNQIIGGGENTSLGVYEVKMTLETEDLLQMNWLGGLNPDGGLKLLDAPGEGKLNMLLFGASATWLPGEGEMAMGSSQLKSLEDQLKSKQRALNALQVAKEEASGTTLCEDQIAALTKQIQIIMTELTNRTEDRTKANQVYTENQRVLNNLINAVNKLENYYTSLLSAPGVSDGLRYPNGGITRYDELIEGDITNITDLIEVIANAIQGTTYESGWTKASTVLTQSGAPIDDAIDLLKSLLGLYNQYRDDFKMEEAAATQAYDTAKTALEQQLKALEKAREDLSANCKDDDNDIDYDTDIDRYNKEIGDLKYKINNLGSPGVEMAACAGLVSKPYAEYRSLDIYYKTPGHNGSWETETAMSIPLLREPFATWTGKSRNETLGGVRNGQLDNFQLYNQQEPLNIDGTLDTQVWQPLLEGNGSGISNHSSVNAEMWIAVNGALKSGHVGKELPSCGKIIITMYYGLFDLKDAAPTRVAKTQQLPAFDQPYAAQVPEERGGGFIFDGMDFLDVDFMSPPMHEWDNWAGTRGASDADDWFRVYRAERDAYNKSENEWQLALQNRSDGQRVPGDNQRLSKRGDVSGFPLPNFFNRGTFKTPTYNGPDATNFGWSYWANDWDEILWKHEDDSIPQDEWQYEPAPIAFKQRERRYAIEISQGVTWLEQVGKIVDFQITVPGQGYNIGDRIHVNPCDDYGNADQASWNWSKLEDGQNIPYEDPMRVGNGCVAEVTQVDSNGGVLKIKIKQNICGSVNNSKTTGWYGGFLYDETANATAGMGQPNNAEDAKMLENMIDNLKDTHDQISKVNNSITQYNSEISSLLLSVSQKEKEIEELNKKLDLLEAMSTLDPDTIAAVEDQIAKAVSDLKDLQQQLQDTLANLDKLEDSLVELEKVLSEQQAQLNQWLSENPTVVCQITPVVSDIDCWVPDENNYQLFELNGKPGIYPNSYQYASFQQGVTGRVNLEELEETKRASRDAALRAESESVRASSPVTWANLKVPEFQIKKYKL
jgi:predicted  nucleic acid-binding Zn-ribbon protein